MDFFNDTINDQTIASNDAFEAMYIDIRKKEKRIYDDRQVELLPLIHTQHIHFREWQVRRRSANRLLTYLSKKKRPLAILEIGCGNGWLSAKMADIGGSHVTGIDINKTELEQAKRVFSKKKTLDFINIDHRVDFFAGKEFDVIVFAASIQYFDELQNIIPETFSLLKDDGEIHILDTHFYHSFEIEEARNRSIAHYKTLGHIAMAANYFHHGFDSLKYFKYRILFNPTTLKNKLLKTRDPFPWIVVTKQ